MFLIQKPWWFLGILWIFHSLSRSLMLLQQTKESTAGTMCLLLLMAKRIKDSSFCTSWKFNGYLNRTCFLFYWVDIFRKIWIITHWFEKLLIPCSSLFSLNVQYRRFRYFNFSFRVNKFSWDCLMNKKILLINGAKEKKKKFVKKILYMNIVLFIDWRHFVANYSMYEMFLILLAGRNWRNPKLSWTRGVLRIFCASRKAA